MDLIPIKLLMNETFVFILVSLIIISIGLILMDLHKENYDDKF